MAEKRIMKENKAISDLRKALLNWYPFAPDGCVLLIGEDADPLAELMEERCARVDQLPYDGLRTPVFEGGSYDYVIAAGFPGREAEKLLKSVSEMLKPDGVLLLGFRNRFGLKYLCGSLDKDIRIPFAGVTGSLDGAHLFSKQEMNGLLHDAGFPRIRYYYPMPDAGFTQAVYTDEYLPEGSIRDRVFPYDPYHSPFVMAEADLYDDVIREKMLPFTANYFLAECRKPDAREPERHVIYAALSTDRGPEHGFATVLYSDESACKKPLSEAGMASLKKLFENSEELRRRGILTVGQKMTDEGIVMPLVREPAFLSILQQFLHRDRQKFLDCMNEILRDVLRSSEPGSLSDAEAEAEWGLKAAALGPVLRKAYIDMIPYNAFYADGRMRYYDQEFTVDNCPALYVLFRAVRYTWIHIREAEVLFPLEEAKRYFGLTETWDAFLKRENRFVAENRNYRDLKQLYEWAAIDREGIGRRLQMLAGDVADHAREEPLLRDVHVVQLRLLRELDRVCKANGLRYMAIHGTLLGAVRHHGFIPWDDDIDIVIPRKDYDRLLSLGKAGFSDPFFLQTPINNYGCYYGGYSKLRYSGTAALEPQNEGRSPSNCHQGIWIDIFPLDSYPAEEKAQDALQRKQRFLQRLIYSKAYPISAGVMRDVPVWKKVAYKILTRFMRRRDLIAAFDRLCRQGHGHQLLAITACYYGERKNKNVWPAEWFASAENMPFEDMCLPVPEKWDAVLVKRFGADYLTLPPMEKRYRHHNVVFYPNLEVLDAEER